MRTTDALGHRLPNHRIARKNIVVVQDDFDGIFEPCNLHGKLYSSYLDAFDLRASQSLKRDRRARFFTNDNIYWRGRCLNGPLLTRQAPQRDEWLRRNKEILHQNTPLADKLLKDTDRYHHIPHTGWDAHQIATGCITGSLHLSILDDEKPFKSPDMITENLGVPVAFEIGSKVYENTYIPDYLFGVDRYFILEVDLGNEVGRASEPHLRKTLERMVLQILSLIEDGLYHEAYGIPRNKAMLALIVSTSEAKLKLIESIIAQHVGACNFILMKHVPAEAFSAYHSPKPIEGLWTEPWKRVGRSEFYINNPARQ